MATGSRCDILDRIDELDGAMTVAQLRGMIKPILKELALLAINSEGAVLEAHEEWRDEYTTELYNETSQDSKNYAKARDPAAQLPTPKSKKAAARAEIADADIARRQAPPPANRPKANDVPASLMAIMNGTHPSLKQK